MVTFQIKHFAFPTISTDFWPWTPARSSASASATSSVSPPGLFLPVAEMVNPRFWDRRGATPSWRAFCAASGSTGTRCSASASCCSPASVYRHPDYPNRFSPASVYRPGYPHPRWRTSCRSPLVAAQGSFLAPWPGKTTARPSRRGSGSFWEFRENRLRATENRSFFSARIWKL